MDLYKRSRFFFQFNYKRYLKSIEKDYKSYKDYIYYIFLENENIIFSLHHFNDNYLHYSKKNAFLIRFMLLGEAFENLNFPRTILQ